MTASVQSDFALQLLELRGGKTSPTKLRRPLLESHRKLELAMIFTKDSDVKLGSCTDLTDAALSYFVFLLAEALFRSNTTST